MKQGDYKVIDVDFKSENALLDSLDILRHIQSWKKSKHLLLTSQKITIEESY